EHARGDLPGESPAILAPPALAFLAAIADDRVPVAVRLFLIVRRDLEGKGLAVLERRAAVEAETGNAQHGEVHRQFVALLAARVITGRRVNRGHFAIRKGGGVEARRLMGVLVEPEADRVLWFHVREFLCSIGDRRSNAITAPSRTSHMTSADQPESIERWESEAYCKSFRRTCGSLRPYTSCFEERHVASHDAR